MIHTATPPYTPTFRFFLFNYTATTEIYTLSLHDALPISRRPAGSRRSRNSSYREVSRPRRRDRKSTRLNSSHVSISYAVFCLKKKTHLFTFLVKGCNRQTRTTRSEFKCYYCLRSFSQIAA